MIQSPVSFRSLSRLAALTLLLGGMTDASNTAFAGTIEYVVNRVDGAVYFKNTGAAPSVIDGYTISSPGAALLVGGWTPVTGNYDVSGDQSVDANSDWFVIGTPTSTSVSEAAFAVGGGALSAGEVVSLGLLFDKSKPEVLNVTIAFTVQMGSSTVSSTEPITGVFRNLQADYNHDLNVDLADYGVFTATYGSTTDLRADGNGDGVVNAADYTVWRDSPALSPGFATAVFPTAFSGSFAASIPEPTAALLALGSLVVVACRRR